MARSRPIEVCSPCPGRTTTSSGRVSTLSRRVRSIVGWSPPGRSVRPIEPAKSRSPENITCETASSYGVRNATDPPVWPGVWSTVTSRPASSSTWPSASSATSSGSTNSKRPPSSMAAVSERDARHRVGQQVPVGRVDPGGGVVGAGNGRHRPHVVEVTVGEQHRDRLERVLPHDLGDPVRGVLPGVDDHALRARPGRRDVAVRGPGACGKAGDEHPGRLSTGVLTPGTGARRLRMRWRRSGEPRLA